MNKLPISEVVRDAAPRLLALPGVVGIAESSEQGEPCVVVYVTEESAGTIPLTLQGYDVVVRRSGEIHAQEEDLT